MAVILAVSGLFAVTPSHAAQDMVLVLDNSGSMRDHDPSLLLRLTVADFLSSVGPGTHVGIVVFDSSARLVAPLADPAQTAGQTNGHVASLANVDYGGSRTNIPAAVERAMYELRVNGRAGSERSIVLLTDGFVDLGSDTETRDARVWLTSTLVKEAEVLGIRIFGLAFSEDADFQLLQALAVETHGEYFRTFAPADVAPVLRRITGVMAAAPGRGSTQLAGGKAGVEPPPRMPSVPPERTGHSGSSSPSALIVPLEKGAQTGGSAVGGGVGSGGVDGDYATESRMDADADPASQAGLDTGGLSTDDFWTRYPWLALVLALAAALGLTVLLLSRRKRPTEHADDDAGIEIPGPSPSGEYFPEAFLVDLHGVTGIPKHRLAGKYNLITRIDGYDQSKMHAIIVPKSTVGRRHAMIEYREFGFWLIDQNSVNGTFLNGERVNTEVPLKHGDRIRFHRYEFEFAMSDMIFSNETIANLGDVEPEFL